MDDENNLIYPAYIFVKQILILQENVFQLTFTQEAVIFKCGKFRCSRNDVWNTSSMFKYSFDSAWKTNK